MDFKVMRPFKWDGRNMERGDVLEIPDESPKIGSLSRAKFIRFHSEPKVQPTIKEVVEEMEAVAAPVATAVLDPKAVVRAAKERAKAAVKN